MSLLKRKRQDTDDANLEKEVVPRQPSPIQSDSSDDSGSESDDVDDADAELKQKQPPMVASSSTTTALPEWFKRGRALASGTTAPVPLQTLGLPAAVLDVLRSQFRIQSWFAMQAEVIPAVLSARAQGHDVCVSAPTGSGKTLAYLIPLLATLHTRVVPRLRALIVLPTRDLARQVHEVLRPLAAAVGLCAELATGQHGAFSAEQHRLVGGDQISPEVLASLRGGSSLVDILVCTPGRLLDHLQSTPGFTLQHLEFLVIDEADRLLNQSYADWTHRVVSAATRSSTNSSLHSGSLSHAIRGSLNDAMADSELTAHILGLPRGVRGCYQTLLFSATLTKDPSKLGALRLRNPLFFTAGTPSHHPTEDGSAPAKSFTVAAGLKEYLIVTTVQDKPLALLHLLQKRDQQHSPTLVFCASVEATHRLFRLLELLFAADQSAGKRVTPVAEYSSVLPQNARTAILARFRAGTVRTLICSDAMARGMDVDGVALVVNYDCPVFARTYVHRCGRTARGGREGEAVTLCRPEEVRHFKALLRKIEGARTQQLTLQHDMLHPAKKKYAAALNALKEVIRCERIGEQHSAQPLKSSRLTDLRARFVRLAEPTPRVTEPSAAKAEAIEGAVDEGVDDIEALSATLLTAAGETEEVDDEVDE